jgi:hypothetical protein
VTNIVVGLALFLVVIIVLAALSDRRDRRVGIDPDDHLRSLRETRKTVGQRRRGILPKGTPNADGRNRRPKRSQ